MSQTEIVVRLRFPGVREEIARVRTLVESVLLDMPGAPFRGEEIAEIGLGLQESLTNAVRHARDAGGPLALVVRVAGRRFSAALTNRGAAFDPEALPPPDPRAPRDHGNGIWLLRRTMDRVDFARRGGFNRVHMERAGRDGGDPP